MTEHVEENRTSALVFVYRKVPCVFYGFVLPANTLNTDAVVYYWHTLKYTCTSLQQLDVKPLWHVRSLCKLFHVSYEKGSYWRKIEMQHWHMMPESNQIIFIDHIATVGFTICAVNDFFCP